MFLIIQKQKKEAPFPYEEYFLKSEEKEHSPVRSLQKMTAHKWRYPQAPLPPDPVLSYHKYAS